MLPAIHSNIPVVVVILFSLRRKIDWLAVFVTA
ncbi:hypothetical protein FBY06_1253 [Pseudomonas sp. SJZ085]|nr:hypothetical protein FBX99_125103 [Pseudomonas sp. SJZ074]TWC33060.1 hypothetical protein FBY06_1253 [Pseudomonas sp. SJZ085]